MKSYECFYCGQVAEGVDLICFDGPKTEDGKVCWYICPDCKDEILEKSEILRSFFMALKEKDGQ